MRGECGDRELHVRHNTSADLIWLIIWRKRAGVSIYLVIDSGNSRTKSYGLSKLCVETEVNKISSFGREMSAFVRK